MATGDQYADRGMPQGIDEKPGTIQRRWGDKSPLSAPGVAKKPDVSTPMASYLAMVPKWEIIDTVLGGTASMRAAGEKYLPRHQYEGNEAYKERLDRATLKNYTLRTLENLTSKAFRDPPILNDDVPEQIKKLLEDADTEGNNFLVFSRAWFRSSVQRAFGFVLVDHTRAQVIEGRERTLDDDRKEGVRPFWRLVDAADMLFLRAEKVGDKVRVVEARIREWETEQDGEWGQKTVERIRVLRPGTFELYEKRIVRKGAKPKWVRVDGGPMGLDYVPIVSFYTSKEGLADGKPVLEDLAYLNVEHFQSSADQRSILTVARFPILAVSGASNADPNGEPVVIGPKKWLSVADPQGRIYYVEHAGNAIAAGRTDLEDLEDQMASYGSEFLRKRPGASSATGRALDSAEAISPLMAWGMDFKDALELALQYTADWLKLGEGKGGSVAYQIKPDVSVGESKELDALDSARERRDISRKAYLGELQRRDILSPEYDADKDKTELDKEPPPEQNGFEATIKSSGRGSAPKDPEGTGTPQKRGPERTTGEPPLNAE
ncbi:portal protein [Rhodobacter phage RcRudolph]|nr:portal protein [Rhodobacter phage RcRudolph]